MFLFFLQIGKFFAEGVLNRIYVDVKKIYGFCKEILRSEAAAEWQFIVNEYIVFGGMTSANSVVAMIMNDNDNGF
ncbi:MAG: hypothetical protein PUK70_05080 [Bacteroidales bacterium]|nr:hypothetical protein [Bacteroidales bacterium]MDY6000889.1 hypothetical protein [Candidatus Cryptobacteroides sp.]